MDKVELIRLKKNLFCEVQYMLMDYGLDRDENFVQHIADEIAQKYVERREH